MRPLGFVGVVAWALAGCSGGGATTDATATEGTAAEGTTTEGDELAGCERREPDAMSPPGFRWSLGCVGSPAYSELARTDDGGVAAVYSLFLAAGPVDLGGEVFSALGSGDVVLGRYDGAGGHLWSEQVATDDEGARGLVGALPGGGVVVAMSSRAPVTLGGVTVPVDPTRGVVVAFALAGDGSHRWSAVIEGMSAGASILPRWMKSSPGGLSALWINTFEPVSIAGEGPYEPSFSGELAILFAADGSLLRADAPPDGQPLALADDGSLLLDAGALRWTDAAWVEVWSRTFDGVGGRGELHGALGPTGDVVIATQFAISIDLGGGVLENDQPFDFVLGNYDVALARYAGDGAHVWSAARGDAWFPMDVGVDADGSMTVALVTDARAVRIEALDPAGAPISDLQTPIARSARVAAVALGGGAVIQGLADVEVDLGGGSMPLHGDHQVWLTRYAP